MGDVRGPDQAILMVDDELLILMAMRNELSAALGLNYRYEIAKSAEEGMTLIRELAEAGITIVAVISDWLMPGMKGDEFLRKVREAHPRVCTIMVSGMVEDATVHTLRETGALDAFFSKPWNGRQVAQICKALFEGR